MKLSEFTGLQLQSWPAFGIIKVMHLHLLFFIGQILISRRQKSLSKVAKYKAQNLQTRGTVSFIKPKPEQNFLEPFAQGSGERKGRKS